MQSASRKNHAPRLPGLRNQPPSRNRPFDSLVPASGPKPAACATLAPMALHRAAWPILAMALAACAGQPPATSPPAPSLAQLDAWPEGFATEYGLVFDMPHSVEPYPEASLDGALMIFERLTFVGPDGTTAGTAEFSALESRQPDQTVTCRGRRWEGRHAYDVQDPPGELNGELEGGITVRLVPDRQVVVYEDTGATGGYPECWEQTGRYVLTFPTGATPGVKTGSFHWLDGTLELE